MATRVARSLYTSLQRTAKRLDKLIVDKSVPSREIKRLQRFMPDGLRSPPVAGSTSGSDGSGAAAEYKNVSEMVLTAFHDISAESSEDLMSTGFDSLKRMDDRICDLEAEGFRPKLKHITLDVGQIYRHKKWGYRGVIIGWFPECPCNEEWIENFGPFENGLSQAFYRTLVDTRDRPAFMTIAAEENLIPLDDETLGIQHPQMEAYFWGFERGRHVLSDELRCYYPDEG